MLCMNILIYIKIRRNFFARMQFTEEGVYSICGNKPDFFIPWSECREIGIGWAYFGRGRDCNYCLYFSRNEPELKFIRNIDLGVFNNDFLWIELVTTKEWRELTKYIDESRIKDRLLIKEKLIKARVI